MTGLGGGGGLSVRFRSRTVVLGGSTGLGLPQSRTLTLLKSSGLPALLPVEALVRLGGLSPV